MTEEDKTPEADEAEAPNAEPQAPAAAEEETVDQTVAAAAEDADEAAAEPTAEKPAAKKTAAKKTAAKKTAAKKTTAKKTTAKKTTAKAAADEADDAPADEATADAPAEEAAPAKPAARRRGRKADEPAAKPAAGKPKPGEARPVVRAQAKYVRTSARKARLVCDHIRGKSVEEARAILHHTPRAVSEDWIKLLESAVANAENNNALDADDLKILKVFADEGPTLKRFRPRAMGRATRIRKRTSHLTIQLTTKE